MRIKKDELVDLCKDLIVNKGYTRCKGDAGYDSTQKNSVQDHFEQKGGIKLTKSEVRGWFKMSELKGVRRPKPSASNKVQLD